jgi:hypothetical protein
MQIAQFQVERFRELFEVHARAVYLDYLSHSQPTMQVPRRYSFQLSATRQYACQPLGDAGYRAL